MGKRPHFLIMTASADVRAVAAAMRSGVRGYLPKDASPEEVRHAIWIVSRGGSVFGPAATCWLESLLHGAPTLPGAWALPALSPREREVLELMSRGTDNRGIARSLYIAEKTVRNHVSSIFARLHVTSRAEAVARARDLGFGASLPAAPPDATGTSGRLARQ
jgi:DNA-binding NarL/FixJ family response regulator